jgi:hypothetical protein
MTSQWIPTRVIAICATAGALIAPTAHSGHDQVMLLSVDSPLDGSDTAIILGGTFEPTPTTAFAQAVENLYLRPLGFDDGATYSTVCDMIATDPCSAPLQVLTTPELFQQGPSSLAAASDVVLAVENELDADPAAFSAEQPLTIFGYSQSATAESIAMNRLEQAGIPSGDVHFVFLGNPSAPDGVMPNLEADLSAWVGPNNALAILNGFGLDGAVGVQTPNDLYPTTIYTLDTDGVADWQEDYAAGGGNAAGLLDALGHVLLQHAEYLGLTPAEIADTTTSLDSDVTNIDISDDINNAAAWFGAIDHGLFSSGFLQAFFDSVEYALGSFGS